MSSPSLLIFALAATPAFASRPPIIALSSGAQRSHVRSQLMAGTSGKRITFIPTVPPDWLGWSLGTNALGIASGFLTTRLASSKSQAWYDRLRKPSWFPPAGLFGPMWTILYSTLGYAAAVVAATPANSARSAALATYVGHMLINLAWPPIFYGARNMGLALKWSVALCGAGLFNALKFGAIEPFAGWLFVPYLCWCGFATALTWKLNQLNAKGPGPGRPRKSSD